MSGRAGMMICLANRSSPLAANFASPVLPRDRLAWWSPCQRLGSTEEHPIYAQTKPAPSAPLA